MKCGKSHQRTFEFNKLYFIINISNFAKLPALRALAVWCDAITIDSEGKSRESEQFVFFFFCFSHGELKIRGKWPHRWHSCFAAATSSSPDFRFIARQSPEPTTISTGNNWKKQPRKSIPYTLFKHTGTQRKKPIVQYLKMPDSCVPSLLVLFCSSHLFFAL